MKYLIVDFIFVETPILFPDHIPHDAVALAFPGCIISAGFYSLENHCASGHSTSLNIPSRPEDSLLIERFLKAHSGDENADCSRDPSGRAGLKFIPGPMLETGEANCSRDPLGRAPIGHPIAPIDQALSAA